MYRPRNNDSNRNRTIYYGDTKSENSRSNRINATSNESLRLRIMKLKEATEATKDKQEIWAMTVNQQAEGAAQALHA